MANWYAKSSYTLHFVILFFYYFTSVKALF
jgi:hypothetical protein